MPAAPSVSYPAAPAAIVSPYASAALKDILGTTQRTKLCRKIALQRRERRARSDDSLGRFFDDLFHSLKDEARAIELTETADIVLREGITLRDLLDCEISIAQIHQYWAPDIQGLQRLVPRYADLLSHRTLLTPLLLVQLYDPDELRALFKITPRSIVLQPLPGPDLLMLGFRFREDTFFRTAQDLRYSGLDPDSCAELGVTATMLATLGITANTTVRAYQTMGFDARSWNPAAFQRAFGGPHRET